MVVGMKKWITLCILVICLLVSSSVIVYIQLLPRIKEYGQMEVQRFQQLVISNAYLTKQSQYQDLVIIERNQQGEIELIDFDLIKVNQLASQIVKDIENTFSAIEEGTYQAQDQSYYQRRMEKIAQDGIVSQISIASLLHLPLLNPLLPHISLKFKNISSVGSSVVKSIENYGVNHVMVELAVEVKIDMTMIYPFFEQYQSHQVRIPILLEIFQGQVPLVYQQ